MSENPNIDTDVVVSSKSRFKGDAANKEKVGKPKATVLPVYIKRFPLALYERMVAFQKKHDLKGDFSGFCLQLIENQFYTEESLDIAADVRKAKEVKPDGPRA